MSFPRDAVGVSVLGDKVYAVGGYDGQHYLKVGPWGFWGVNR